MRDEGSQRLFWGYNKYKWIIRVISRGKKLNNKKNNNNTIQYTIPPTRVIVNHNKYIEIELKEKGVWMDGGIVEGKEWEIGY